VRLTRPRPLGGHKDGDSATAEQVLQADAPVVTASTETTTTTTATDAGMQSCVGVLPLLLLVVVGVVVLLLLSSLCLSWVRIHAS
jgi:hypothetical protein